MRNARMKLESPHPVLYCQTKSEFLVVSKNVSIPRAARRRIAMTPDAPPTASRTPENKTVNRFRTVNPELPKRAQNHAGMLRRLYNGLILIIFGCNNRLYIHARIIIKFLEKDHWKRWSNMFFYKQARARSWYKLQYEPFNDSGSKWRLSQKSSRK